VFDTAGPARSQTDDGSSVEVGGAPMSRLAGSDWDSGSVSSSAGQSPLNGTHSTQAFSRNFLREDAPLSGGIPLSPSLSLPFPSPQK